MRKEEFEDKQIFCKICGEVFTFTAGEQGFFTDRGLEEPKRCPECRRPKGVRHG